jgi:hypothetical protein
MKKTIGHAMFLSLAFISSAHSQSLNRASEVQCSNDAIQCRIGPAPQYAPNYYIPSPKDSKADPQLPEFRDGQTYTGEPGRRLYRSPAGQAIARGATGYKLKTIVGENRTYSYVYNEPDPETIERIENNAKNLGVEPPAPYKPAITKP